MPPEQKPVLSFERTSLEGCPGDVLDFPFTLSDADADAVPRFVSRPQQRLAGSTVRTEVARASGGTIRGHVHYLIPEDPKPDPGDYQLVLEDADLGLSATVQVTVTGVSLKAPKFAWKDGKLSASIEVKSCTPLKPEATFTLSCSEGTLVLTGDIKVTSELPGGSTVELEFPQYQQQLGACELNFYEDGPATEPTASHPIEPQQLQPPRPSPRHGTPKPRPWKIPLAIAGALLGAIALAVALLPDDGGGNGVAAPVVRRDISVSVLGSGEVEIASTEDRAVLGDGDTFTTEDGAALVVQANPNEGWRFDSWRGLDSSDFRISVDATEDLNLVALFVEPSLSDLICTAEDHGEIVVECTAEAFDFGPDPGWFWSAPQSVFLDQPEPTRVEAVFVGEGSRPWSFEIELDVCDSLEAVCLRSNVELIIEGTPDLAVVPSRFDPAQAGVELFGDSDGCTTLFAIQNIGDAAAASSTVLVSIFGADTIFRASEAVPALNPGEAAFIELFVPTSGFCQHNPDSAGEIEADARGAVDESDEANNTLGWLSIG